jgi:lambda family phage portal protein
MNKRQLKKLNNSQKDFGNNNDYAKTNYYIPDIVSSIFDGDKFPGSYGTTKSYDYVDYYTLRKRSVELFESNHYARGIIERILQNEIHKGLNLEASPLPKVIGLTEDESINWAEDIETDWQLWSEDCQQVDWQQSKTLGQLQADARMTAMLSGDALIVLRTNQKTGLPSIEIIDGSNVVTPLGYVPRSGNKIVYGVEIDSQKRQVAYHVQTQDNNGTWNYKRVPCFGEKSGRRISWMIYGGRKRIDQVRGIPILGCILYALKEIDRYKDAELRAATLNAIIPLFIKKTEKVAGSLPFGQGAILQKTVQTTNPDNTVQNLNITKNLPGQVFDSLSFGEEPVSFDTKRPNINFAVFEETILNGIAWTLSIPPEVMKIYFQSNFSASRQANNEFNVYLNYRFWQLGCELLQPIYREFEFAEALYNLIPCPGLLDAINNGNSKVINAWTNSEFTGLSRPSVDLLKDVNAANEALKLGITTFDQQSRKISGMPFRVIAQKLAREKQLLKKYGLVSSIDENNNGEAVVNPVEAKTNLILDMVEQINDKKMQ